MVQPKHDSFSRKQEKSSKMDFKPPEGRTVHPKITSYSLPCCSNPVHQTQDFRLKLLFSTQLEWKGDIFKRTIHLQSHTYSILHCFET